jgi:hypothetical protein
MYYIDGLSQRAIAQKLRARPSLEFDRAIFMNPLHPDRQCDHELQERASNERQTSEAYVLTADFSFATYMKFGIMKLFQSSRW